MFADDIYSKLETIFVLCSDGSTVGREQSNFTEDFVGSNPFKLDSNLNTNITTNNAAHHNFRVKQTDYHKIGLNTRSMRKN